MQLSAQQHPSSPSPQSRSRVRGPGHGQCGVAHSPFMSVLRNLGLYLPSYTTYLSPPLLPVSLTLVSCFPITVEMTSVKSGQRRQKSAAGGAHHNLSPDLCNALLRAPQSQARTQPTTQHDHACTSTHHIQARCPHPLAAFATSGRCTARRKGTSRAFLLTPKNPRS